MRNLLCAFLLSIVSISCFAQTYFPVGRTSDQGFKAMGLAPDSLTCAKPPGADDIKYKQFQTKMIVTVGSQMAKLNIAWAGGSINANQLYAVSDTGKFAHCLANDRKTTVIYGRVVRTIVQMNDYEVKGNASIAIVAASATVNGKTNSVDLYEIGYGESKLDSMLVDAKGFVWVPVSTSTIIRSLWTRSRRRKSTRQQYRTRASRWLATSCRSMHLTGASLRPSPSIRSRKDEDAKTH